MKTKRLLSLSLGIIIVLSFLTIPAFARNELQNASFEDQKQDPWYWWGEAGTGTYGVTDYAHTGKKSARIVSDGGDYIVTGFLQDLYCNSKEKIKCSAWLMSPSTDPMTNSVAFVKIEFWKEWELIESFESEHLTGAFGWTKSEVVGIAPKGTTMVKIGLFIWNPGANHSGSVYFDDASLTRGKSLVKSYE